MSAVAFGISTRVASTLTSLKHELTIGRQSSKGTHSEIKRTRESLGNWGGEFLLCGNVRSAKRKSSPGGWLGF
jgi:hypothetical protein